MATTSHIDTEQQQIVAAVQQYRQQHVDESHHEQRQLFDFVISELNDLQFAKAVATYAE